jgi:hypothetical protein
MTVEFFRGFWPLANRAWPMEAGLLSRAACLRVGQQQEASSKKPILKPCFENYLRDAKLGGSGNKVNNFFNRRPGAEDLVNAGIFEFGNVIRGYRAAENQHFIIRSLCIELFDDLGR